MTPAERHRQDLARLEANVDRLIRVAAGYPIEVRVGAFTYVVCTREDLLNLIAELKTRDV